jgi:hypothetical protein
MIIIAEYQLILDKDSSNKYYVKSEESNVCPVCGNPELKVIGSRKRGVLKGDGEAIILIIRRLRCLDCKRIHHELPDMLVPYKRYSSRVIEAIVDDISDEISCEDSSIYRIKRWFQEFSGYIAGCLGAVAAQRGLEIIKSGSVFLRIKAYVGEGASWLARTVRTVVNTNNWLHTRSAFMSF